MGRHLAIVVLLSLAPMATAAQDYAPGEKLTLSNCGRCHVVSPKNRLGGIDSTPSFAALRNIADWEDRMKAFWTLRPHPTFIQITGVTDPFPANRPPTVHPISLTLEELDLILNYTRTIKPAELPDLGMR